MDYGNTKITLHALKVSRIFRMLKLDIIRKKKKREERRRRRRIRPLSRELIFLCKEAGRLNIEHSYKNQTFPPTNRSRQVTAIRPLSMNLYLYIIKEVGSLYTEQSYNNQTLPPTNGMRQVTAKRAYAL